jgi:hypothetical protein
MTPAPRNFRWRGCVVSIAFVALALFAVRLWVKLSIIQYRHCAEVHLDAEGGDWRLYTEVQFPFGMPFSTGEYTIIYDRPSDRSFVPVPLVTIRDTFQEDSSRPVVETRADELVYKSPYGDVHIRLPAEDNSTIRYPIVDVRLKAKENQGLLVLGGRAVSDGPAK